MDGRRVRAAGASLVTVALMGLAASPALAAPGVSVSAVSSLKAGATAGTLTGKVVNDTGKRDAQRGRGADHAPRHEGAASSAARRSRSRAHSSAAYSVAVKLPAGLTQGQLLPLRLHALRHAAPARSAAPRRRTTC